jgi:glycosyltransferase involved in cell wall biosynthesis
MAEVLTNLYPSVRSVVNISGVLTVERRPLMDESDLERPFVLGFLSNVSKEKGVLTFVDVLVELRRRGLDVKGKVAGPIFDSTVKEEIQSRKRELPCLEIIGPVYGAGKERYLDGLSVLVFPTRYINETEGIVIHEAMCRGVPVIASEVACIPELISGDGGKVISDFQRFAVLAADEIENWIVNPMLYKACREVARKRYDINTNNSTQQMSVLMAYVAGFNVLPGENID